MDVIHITEAGIKQQLPTGMTGYKAVTHQRTEINSGSVIWVRECYLNRMVRVYDPEDKDNGSEVIHLLMDTIPPTNILGVYQETGKGIEEVENAHRILRKRVKECEEKGQVAILMGDFNAAVNETAKPFNTQARRILDWEESGDVRILNDKQAPTNIPLKKGDAENCLDFIMITKGLETRTRNYKLDVDRK